MGGFGVKWTALLFGESTQTMLTLFYALAVLLIGASIRLSAGGWLAWAGLLAFAAHLVWQVRAIRVDGPALCLRLFKSNRDAGLLLFAGLVADAVLRANG